mmetsp:Transcript_57915/g.113970  ORF Transcript_57915/g.113970 Transcript_57915/m.113970 type:complete len:292 (-) Transcript_57915:487-1362(-)
MSTRGKMQRVTAGPPPAAPPPLLTPCSLLSRGVARAAAAAAAAASASAAKEGGTFSAAAPQTRSTLVSSMARLRTSTNAQAKEGSDTAGARWNGQKGMGLAGGALRTHPAQQHTRPPAESEGGLSARKLASPALLVSNLPPPVVSFFTLLPSPPSTIWSPPPPPPPHPWSSTLGTRSASYATRSQRCSAATSAASLPSTTARACRPRGPRKSKSAASGPAGTAEAKTDPLRLGSREAQARKEDSGLRHSLSTRSAISRVQRCSSPQLCLLRKRWRAFSMPAGTMPLPRARS